MPEPLISDGIPQHHVLTFYVFQAWILHSLIHDVQTCAMCFGLVYIGYPHALSLLSYNRVKSIRCEMPKFGLTKSPLFSLRNLNFGREIQGLVVKFTWRVNSPGSEN